MKTYFVIKYKAGSFEGYVTKRKSGNYSHVPEFAAKWETAAQADAWMRKNGKPKSAYKVEKHAVTKD